MTTKDRIKRLEQLILRYRTSYYSGDEEIADAEYDALEKELTKLCPTSSVLKEIGKDGTEGYRKIKHVIHMGSQHKASNKAEFWNWFKSQRDSAYIAQEKIDGSSLELQYRNGVLCYAITRGDGVIGDDVTSNMKKVPSIPHTLRSNNTLAIRGEIVLPNSIFDKKYINENANPRNMTAGIMKRKDGKGCEDLNFIAYDLYPPFANPGTEEQKLTYLIDNGFGIPKYSVINVNTKIPDANKIAYSTICTIRDDFMNMRGNESASDYNYDGMVIKHNTVHIDDSLLDRPKRQIAFKFDLEIGVSEMIDVEWYTSGRTRTPVAIFKPIQLNGTTVERASLSNPRIFESFNLYKGTIVHVQKGGEIIPKIIRSHNLGIPNKKDKFIPPDFCPYCMQELIYTPSELYCPNKKCPEVLIHQMSKWIDVHKIQHIGDVSLRWIIGEGIAMSIAELYDMTPELIVGTTNIGIANATKIVNQVQTVGRNTSISKFIAGLDITDVGETIVELIVNKLHLTSIHEFLRLTYNDIIDIHGIGDSTANAICEGLKYHHDLIIQLIPLMRFKVAIQSGKLSNKLFVITGAIEGMSRKDAYAKIREAGGNYTEIVNNKVDYVVSDTTDMSSKKKKAKHLNIPIINSLQLKEMW